MTRAVAWEQVVEAVERVKGEPWESFRDRHGDWGRDAVLWLGRRIGRLKLAQLAEKIGGLDYTAAGAAVSRFNRRLAKDRNLSATLCDTWSSDGAWHFIDTEMENQAQRFYRLTPEPVAEADE